MHEGVHVQRGRDGINYLDLYRFGGMTYHIPCKEIPEDETAVLGEIIGEIGADATRPCSMKFEQAKQVLNDYIAKDMKKESTDQ